MRKNNYNLKDLQLYKEDTKYYLTAIYQYETERGIYEVTIPKIYLHTGEPIIKKPFDVYHSGINLDPTTIDLGFGDCVICEDEKGYSYYDVLIKEKVHDLTLSEIEKKLGYKVRVVSEKEM